MKVRRVKDFVQLKLSQGYYTFSLREVEAVLGAGETTWKAVNLMAKQGWLFSPSKGFYVIIDPQHQGTGYLPVEWFVDDWMNYLGGRYYVGLLTAAMLHGASHQKPQQFHIVRDRTFTNLRKGPYNIFFFYKKIITDNFREQKKSPAGYYWASSPEVTGYDILSYPKACPSLNLAATIIKELGESIRPEKLADLVDHGAKLAVLQRLGWLLENTGWALKTEILADRLRTEPMVWRAMRADLPMVGLRESRWKIVVNTEIEADI